MLLMPRDRYEAYNLMPCKDRDLPWFCHWFPGGTFLCGLLSCGWNRSSQHHSLGRYKFTIFKLKPHFNFLNRFENIFQVLLDEFINAANKERKRLKNLEFESK